MMFKMFIPLEMIPIRMTPRKAPKTVPFPPLTLTPPMIAAAMEACENGTFSELGTLYGTLQNGGLSAGKINDLVPAEVQEKYNAYLQQMLDDPFMK